MIAELWIKTYETLLREGRMTASSLSARVKGDARFLQLLEAGVIALRRVGAGKVYVVEDEVLLRRSFAAQFPGAATVVEQPTGISNSLRSGNSKDGRRTDRYPTFLLRGWQPVMVRGEPFDLASFTRRYGSIGLTAQTLSCERICVVENKDVFFRAEELLGIDAVYLHPYGRAGRPLFELLAADYFFHWPDYDYTGLAEFIRFRKTHPAVELCVPEPLEALWASSATPIKRKDYLPESVRTSTLPEVVRIRTLLSLSNAFLEQQICFGEQATLTPLVSESKP